MSSAFLKKGNCFHVTSTDALNLHNLLPAGNYVVKFDPQQGFYLEEIDAFTLPSRIYGTSVKDAERILNTFQNRRKTTGVLLSGEKGSGKTLLAKEVSIRAATLGIPTIAVTSNFTGESFDTFLQTIEQPSIILFDEFEKVYETEKQSEILTLLDGVFSSEKMFVFTCNDRWKINIHMRNRPGRVFYAMEFKGLDRDFIVDYCRENLNDQSQIDSICALAMLFDQFNFDMLQSLVEEMNRYGETVEQAIRMLNVKPESQEAAAYDVKLFVDGKAIPSGSIYDDYSEGDTWRGKPLSGTFSIMYDTSAEDADGSKYVNAVFQPSDLKKLDSDSGEYNFINTKGERIILKRQRPETFDFRRAI